MSCVISHFDDRLVQTSEPVLCEPCIYGKETFPRYAVGKLLDREKNAEEQKVSSRPGFAL